MGVVKGASDAGEGVHENKDILPLFNQPLGAIHGDLRNACVAAEITVIGTGVQLGLGNGAPDLGDLFRAFIDKQDNELHLRVILHDSIGDMLKQRRLARAGRGDNKSSLPLADGCHEIHHAGGEALGNGLQPDPLVGADGGQLLKERDVHELLGSLALDLGSPEKLGAAGSPAGLPLDENTIAQVVLTNHLGRDKDIVLRGGVGTLCFAQEAKTLAGNLDNTLGIGRLGRGAVQSGSH